jgi:hypothetical protein
MCKVVGVSEVCCSTPGVRSVIRNIINIITSG